MFFVRNMQQNFNLVVAVVGSICACFSHGQAPKAVFTQEPQNLTLLDLEKPFFFNCSTDIAFRDGMDWTVRINGNHERICLSADFYLTGDSGCPLNYSMEVPNNRTLNLIVDPRIARLGDEYCCQFDNGAGKKSCSYLTISPATEPAFTDSTTTVFSHKNTTVSDESPATNTGSIVGIVLGAVVILAIIIIALVVQKKRKMGKPSAGPTNGNESSIPLSPGTTAIE